MKKILFAMAVLFGCTMESNAQTNFIATLQHEGEFTQYYGAGALQLAYNAAAENDTITLSPGTFTFDSYFVKGITLRGAGIAASEPTYISSGICFYAQEVTQQIIVEGIIFNNFIYIRGIEGDEIKKAGKIDFIKCHFQYLRSDNYRSVNVEDVFPSVRVYNSSIFRMEFDSNTTPNFLFYNCYVDTPSCNSSSIPVNKTTFINCLINWNSYANYAYNLSFYNCIFNWYGTYGGSYTSYTLPSSATCYNCLSINKSTIFREVVSGRDNKTVDNIADIFKTFNGGYYIGDNCELTDEAKTTYIGTDGTEIGMNGGNYPFTTKVQYPVVTKFNVSPNTTKEGILNLDVEVDGK